VEHQDGLDGLVDVPACERSAEVVVVGAVHLEGQEGGSELEVEVDDRTDHAVCILAGVVDPDVESSHNLVVDILDVVVDDVGVEAGHVVEGELDQRVIVIPVKSVGV